jgi:hypothetical protein
MKVSAFSNEFSFFLSFFLNAINPSLDFILNQNKNNSSNISRLRKKERDALS